MADVLDRLGNPDAVTLKRLAANADGDFATWLAGQWVIDGARQAVYAKQTMSIRERFEASSALLSTASKARTPSF